jgi:hypothetical protein
MALLFWFCVGIIIGATVVMICYGRAYSDLKTQCRIRVFEAEEAVNRARDICDSRCRATYKQEEELRSARNLLSELASGIKSAEHTLSEITDRINNYPWSNND